MFLKYLLSVKQVTVTKSSIKYLSTVKRSDAYNKHNIHLKQFNEFNLTSTLTKKRFSLQSCKQASLFNSNNSQFIRCLRRHNLLRTNSIFTSNKILDDKNIFENDLERICIKYPSPKSILHNYYSIVAKELKLSNQLITQYKIAPHRKGDKNREWTCTYNVKWPEEIKVTGTAMTKADASKKAASKMLYLLEKARKILHNGQPILYDKETFNKITKKSYLPIELDHNVENKLQEICDIYAGNIREHVEKSLSKDQVLSTSQDINLENDNDLQRSPISRQKSDNISTYYAKESVDLPVQAHRKELEKLLNDNRIVIIRGEPGCGKSTRIPQYVLEHWVRSRGLEHVKIVVTQPRRIAAISLAERVADERQERVGAVVGYQVRLKSNFNHQTGRILYCTTGILLRQLQSDASLRDCTHVILDEAHERDVNTDLLMNLLRHALKLNPNLQILVMSATIDVKLFQNYFNNAPVMNIPGFTYPVKMHFLDDLKLNLSKTNQMSQQSNPNVMIEDVANVIKWIHKTKPAGAILCFLPGWDEISRVRYLLNRMLDSSGSFVLALHSKLSDSDQRRIFGHPPAGIRKIILATNIAETSVTVDDVVYVVDAGVHKEARWDVEKGVVSMGNHWISRSSMQQRKGRAGRVQAGESFHLYPKSKYESMPDFSIPEILRVYLTKIVLDAKVYSHDMDAIEFFGQLPCAPEDGAVLRAIDELKDLELLDADEKVTPLGRILSEFQLPPKLSKAMVQSVIYKCVTPIIDITTIFSSESEMFSTALTDKQSIKETKQKASKTSDHISLMLLFEQWMNLINDEEFHEANTFCAKNNIISYKLNTLKKLQDIHFEYLNKHLKKVKQLSDDYSDNEEIIKGVLLSGVGNVLMQRNWDIVKGRLKSANVFVTCNGQKATITPESVNNKTAKNKSPFLVYINETRSSVRRTTLIRETSLINPLTLLLFKNRPLFLTKKHDDIDSDIDNGVILQFEGTKLAFLCSKRQAVLIEECQSTMRNVEKYFINQFTEGSETNDEVLDSWNRILDILSKILQSEK